MEAIKQILKIRKRLKRLKDPNTINIYKDAEAFYQQYLIENKMCYINSENKTINIASINPKHLENVYIKYYYNRRKKV